MSETMSETMSESLSKTMSEPMSETMSGQCLKSEFLPLVLLLFYLKESPNREDFLTD